MNDERNLPPTRPSIPETSSPMFLRMPAVVRLTGLCRSTIYRLIADDMFPEPVKVGIRAVAWRQTDLDRWSNDRAPSKH